MFVRPQYWELRSGSTDSLGGGGRGFPERRKSKAAGNPEGQASDVCFKELNYVRGKKTHVCVAAGGAVFSGHNPIGVRVCLCVCVQCAVDLLSKVKKIYFQTSVSANQPWSLAASDVADRGSLHPPSSVLLLAEGGKSLGAKGRPPRATKPHPRPRPPRSPQVEGQRHGEDDPGQHEERQPGLQKGPAAGGRRRDTAVSDAPHRKHRVSRKVWLHFAGQELLVNSCWYDFKFSQNVWRTFLYVMVWMVNFCSVSWLSQCCSLPKRSPFASWNVLAQGLKPKLLNSIQPDFVVSKRITFEMI